MSSAACLYRDRFGCARSPAPDRHVFHWNSPILTAPPSRVPGSPVSTDRVALKEQVKAASDIVAVVGGYLELRQAGPTFKGLCPFHDDHRPSFDVDPRRQRY